MKKNQKSFTLVELLVVIGIISTFSAIILPNYRFSEREFVLQRSAQKLAQDIRRAQQMAMSAKECCGGIIPPGYGIYLKQGDNFYILYADTNPANGNEKYDQGNDSQIEKIYFEKDYIYIKDVSPSSLSINFKPPEPKTKISGDSSKVSEVSIILSSKFDPTKTKTIKVNKAGLIYVE